MGVLGGGGGGCSLRELRGVRSGGRKQTRGKKRDKGRKTQVEDLIGVKCGERKEGGWGGKRGCLKVAGVGGCGRLTLSLRPGR